ncbi:MAG: hypothetical protein JSS27_07620 [Planctomycetes bacterium]|nr:hypothetical protein [Planctomycetota bacterium]
MNVTFDCAKCQHSARVEFDDSTEALACPHCHVEYQVPAGAIQVDSVTRCLVCPSSDLFVRKDFSQRLGVTIVVVGLALSTVTWYYYQIYWTYGILMATALADFAAYFLVGENLTCYRCNAQYRGGVNIDRHGSFDLTIHERYRQQTARLASKA